MAHSLSAKKRIRQNAKRRFRNRVRKSRVKTQARRFREALSSGDVDKAETEFRNVAKLVDRVALKGTIHKNRANRMKSRLQKHLNEERAKKQ